VPDLIILSLVLLTLCLSPLLDVDVYCWCRSIGENVGRGLLGKCPLSRAKPLDNNNIKYIVRPWGDAKTIIPLISATSVQGGPNHQGVCIYSSVFLMQIASLLLTAMLTDAFNSILFYPY
jgi:hypothetical protein